MGGLFERSVATLVRSWAYLASGSPGAEVIEAEGAAIAAFVHSPDRDFLNNAVLHGGPVGLDGTLDLVERTYAERGVDRYAVWVHEREGQVGREVEGRGYVLDTSTRAMAMELADLVAADTSGLDLADLSLAEFWAANGLDNLAPELAPDGAHIYAARHEGEPAATLMAFDHDGDCGIYMVNTEPSARRQGLATALSAHALAAARERGCRTASLQSTPMAERVYARVGFRDLGRFHEFVPRA
jgi:GNAT superfamily N-acetyltransferase